MAELIIDTTSNGALWGGTYKGQMKFDVTYNTATNQYQIKLIAVRTYCQYSWAFDPFISISIAKDSTGTGAVTLTDLRPDYDNSATLKGGWSNWSTNIKSKVLTVVANKDKTCPTVYIKYTDVTGTINSNTTPVSTSCSFTGNISSSVQAKVKPPVLSLTVGKPYSNSIPFTIQTDEKCKDWAYSIDDNAYQNITAVAGTSVNGSVSVSGGVHKLKVRAKKVDNSVLGYAEVSNIDCVSPKITTFTMTPVNATEVEIQLEVDTSCEYTLQRLNDSRFIANAVSIDANKLITQKYQTDSVDTLYIVAVRKKSNTNLVATSVKTCNTAPILLTNLTASAATPQFIGLQFDVNHPCDIYLNNNLIQQNFTDQHYSALIAGQYLNPVLKVTRTAVDSTPNISASSLVLVDNRPITTIASACTMMEKDVIGIQLQDITIPFYINVTVGDKDTSNWVRIDTSQRSMWYRVSLQDIDLNDAEKHSSNLAVRVILCKNPAADAFSSTKTFTVDNAYATLVVKDELLNYEGNSVSFTVTADETMIEDRWILQVFEGDIGSGTEITESVRVSKETAPDQCTFTVANLPYNQSLSILVTGTRSFNLLDSSVLISGVKCDGLMSVWHDEQWAPAYATIYHNEKWVGASVYVYSSKVNGWILANIGEEKDE